MFSSLFKVTGQKLSGQKPLDNKPPRIFEEIIAKYAVDAFDLIQSAFFLIILFSYSELNEKKHPNIW